MGGEAEPGNGCLPFTGHQVLVLRSQRPHSPALDPLLQAHTKHVSPVSGSFPFLPHSDPAQGKGNSPEGRMEGLRQGAEVQGQG